MNRAFESDPRNYKMENALLTVLQRFVKSVLTVENEVREPRG